MHDTSHIVPDERGINIVCIPTVYALEFAVDCLMCSVNSKLPDLVYSLSNELAVYEGLTATQ